MASPFETCNTILTQEQADHINTEHPRTSKFWLTFDLSSTLADLSTKTWEEENEDVELLEEGWKKGHGHYYLYVFTVHKTIGRDPEGFPAKHIAIYYSEKREGKKWEIVTAYPLTRTYHTIFLSKRKPSLPEFFIVRTQNQTAFLGANTWLKVMTNTQSTTCNKPRTCLLTQRIYMFFVFF